LSDFDKLREAICPVLQLEEENQTFVKVGRGRSDFFLSSKILLKIRNLEALLDDGLEA